MLQYITSPLEPPPTTSVLPDTECQQNLLVLGRAEVLELLQSLDIAKEDSPDMVLHICSNVLLHLPSPNCVIYPFHLAISTKPGSWLI